MTNTTDKNIYGKCLLNKKNINLGNLKPTRDFNYVEDVCNAYFEILKNKLENTEKELCAIHDLLDSIDAGAQSNADGTYKNPELDPNASYPDLMKKKANFEAQAKKVQSVLFSSIMTLSQVINQQVGEVFDEKARAGVFGPQAKNAASSAAASEEKDDRIVLN